MPQLWAPVLRYLAEHPIPDLALAANDKVRIVLIQIVDRLRLGELIAVDHQSHDLIAAIRRVVGNDPHREARLGIAETSEKLTLGLHQSAEGEKPDTGWNGRH